MVEDFGLMVGVVIVGAYLPEGWASPLFTRRPRRSRPQGTLRHYQGGALGRFASSPPWLVQLGAPSTADYKSSISLVQKTSKIKKNFLGGKAPKPPSRFNEVKMQDLIESSGEAETAIVAAVTGGVPVAVSRAEEVWTEVPRAAAQNTPRAVA